MKKIYPFSVAHLGMAATTLLTLGASPFSLAHASVVNDNGPVSVQLSGTQIEENMSLPETAPSNTRLEFGLSSWVPSGFSTPSSVVGTPDFSRGDFPSIFINHSSPLRVSGLQLKLGGNFVEMSRCLSDSSLSQSISLLSARAGFEYTPPSMSSGKIVPFGAIALLPTLGIASDSSFAPANTYFGVPIEATLGGRVQMKHLGLRWDDAELELGVSGTEGTVDHSNFSGVGVNAGVRILL